MNLNPQHIENKDLETDLLKNVEAPFKNTKEDIWQNLSNKIDFDKPSHKKSVIIKVGWYKIASAAAILLIFGSTLFLKNYSVRISSSLNEKFSHTLPDNSEVYLNENSYVSYHPYWWFFSREIEFEGEAFFKVQKGEKFTVKSEQGNTSVLGTSFNINSRNNYTVYCKTGKVAVNSGNEMDVVILSPNQMVSFSEGSKFKQDLDLENDVLNWRKTYLNFSSTPLIDVFAELETLYNVNLNYESSEFLNLNYSANYEKPPKVEDVLTMLSLSFNFNFSKQNGIYTIVKTNKPEI